MQPPKPTLPPQPKPLIGKAILKKIQGDGEGEEEAGGESTTKAEQIDELLTLIETANNLGCTGMVEEAEGKLIKLRSEETTPTDVLTDAVNVKDISAEKVKMLNKHQANKTQM